MYPACKYALTAITECLRQEVSYIEMGIKVTVSVEFFFSCEEFAHRISVTMQNIHLIHLHFNIKFSVYIEISSKCVCVYFSCFFSIEYIARISRK